VKNNIHNLDGTINDRSNFKITEEVKKVFKSLELKENHIEKVTNTPEAVFLWTWLEDCFNLIGLILASLFCIILFGYCR